MHPNVKRRMEHNARMNKIMADREAEEKALREYQNSPEAKEIDRQGREFFEEVLIDLAVAIAQERRK